MKASKSISVIFLIITFLILSCSQNAIAKKGEVEEIGMKIAVWGFHHLDRESKSMCKYLKNDFPEVADKIPHVVVIGSKDVNKALGKTKVEELDKENVLDFAKEIGADINIWGQVSQIGATLFNVSFFIFDTQTEDIKFERLQVEKKKEKRLVSVNLILEKAIELKRSAETKAMDIALNFYNSEQYEDAQKAFLDVLNLNPNEKTAYAYLARISAINEDYDSAISCYKQALDIDPEFIEVLEGLAWTYRMNKDCEMACETYEKLADIVPDNIEYIFCVGEIYQELDDFEEAVEAFRAVLEIDSCCIGASKALGILFFDNDDYNEAIPYLKTVLDSLEEASDVEKKLAIAYQKTGRIDASIQQNLDILEKDSTRTAPYLNLAAAYVTQQRFDDALESLRKYISLEPDSPAGYNRISDVYRQMKDYDKAIANAKKSAEITPDKAEPYLLLAEIDNERGYTHYQLFVEYDEKAKNPDLSSEYDENNQLRSLNKKKAQALFISAKDYYIKANTLSADYFMKERLKEKLATVELLIKETKFDPFYDEE
ncbi:MAG: tetratricopeptide repeat protein [Candidatus Cloacimonetes bacterium]|nr:tetratricopeptide repeat protein [Candidatus Cloacimonadota bacterium]